MDDLFGRMRSVLSDPESMKQLQELADIIGEGEEEKKEDEQTPQQEGSSVDTGFDIGKLMGLASLIGSSENDDDAALLLALKPHLGEQRQKKVDKAVKLLRLISIWKILKETGMMNDFL